jgi:hypothetical protein
MVDGQLKTLLVHRKGSTRAFPPHHPLIPVDYQFIGPSSLSLSLSRSSGSGQPVLIGGTMGTCSYVLTGTQQVPPSSFVSSDRPLLACRGWTRPLDQLVTVLDEHRSPPHSSPPHHTLRVAVKVVAF